MCITAYYIDSEWILQKKVLNFCPITSHRGGDIRKMLDKCLKDLGIEKVFCVTVDNAKSMTLLLFFLRKNRLTLVLVWLMVNICMSDVWLIF